MYYSECMLYGHCHSNHHSDSIFHLVCSLIDIVLVITKEQFLDTYIYCTYTTDLFIYYIFYTYITYINDYMSNICTYITYVIHTMYMIIY